MYGLPRGGIKSALIMQITTHLDIIALLTVDVEEEIFQNSNAEGSIGILY